MDLKRLTPEIAVAGQIMPEDVAGSGDIKRA